MIFIWTPVYNILHLQNHFLKISLKQVRRKLFQFFLPYSPTSRFSCKTGMSYLPVYIIYIDLSLMPTVCSGLHTLINYITRVCTAFSRSVIFVLFLVFHFSFCFVLFLVRASPWKPVAQASGHSQVLWSPEPLSMSTSTMNCKLAGARKWIWAVFAFSVKEWHHYQRLWLWTSWCVGLNLQHRKVKLWLTGHIISAQRILYICFYSGKY